MDGKDDKGKPTPLHCPTQIIDDIMEVRAYGVTKYNDPDNWQDVKLSQFINALLRHTLGFWKNADSVDEESGLHHYKHIACNLAFICEKMKARKEVE